MEVSKQVSELIILYINISASNKSIVIQAFSAATAANKESIRIGCAIVPVWPEVIVLSWIKSEKH